MPIVRLGYVAFTVTDLEAWRSFGSELLGFECRSGGKDGPLYLRMDERHHRFALYPAETDSLLAIGWEVADRPSLDALVLRLRDAGIAVSVGTESECASRRVTALARFKDVSDFPCEVYCGAETDGRPFEPGRLIGGFKTGSLGLGHIVLAARDRHRAVQFYQELLGFRISDTVDLANLQLTFLHCNARHHSVAFSGPRPQVAMGVSHIMVELNRMEDVGVAYDLCRSRNLKMRMSLGQHTNDQMLSFYVESPSGFAIEYGYGGLEIDDASWSVQHWKSGSHWGHKLGG